MIFFSEMAFSKSWHAYPCSWIPAIHQSTIFSFTNSDIGTYLRTRLVLLIGFVVTCITSQNVVGNFFKSHCMIVLFPPPFGPAIASISIMSPPFFMWVSTCFINSFWLSVRETIVINSKVYKGIITPYCDKSRFHKKTHISASLLVLFAPRTGRSPDCCYGK